MTVIRLDAATLAEVTAGNGPIYLADENGKPVLELTGTAKVEEQGGEPQLTPEEWRAIRDSPVKYKLGEVWDRIHRGERF